MIFSEYFKQTFEAELINEIHSHAKVISLKEGDVIFEVGQTVRVIPLLLFGTLKSPVLRPHQLTHRQRSDCQYALHACLLTHL